jgi:hypothetical protein
VITQREVGYDGDVESFYLGALDALRERPDVIVIGEIRDAQTAQEALALAEAGPLVLASLRAFDRAGPAENDAPARQYRAAGAGAGACAARRAVPGAACLPGRALLPRHRMPDLESGSHRDDRQRPDRRLRIWMEASRAKAATP